MSSPVREDGLGIEDHNENLYAEYEPLKWPADKRLAELHLKCSAPGKDNIEGAECPCCGRYEKVKVRNWFWRDIIKDFKSYGGGVPAYFELMKYCGVAMLILAAIIVAFHIYVLELVFHEEPRKCARFLHIFKFCDARTIYNQLVNTHRTSLATAFLALQMVTFLYLIIVTIGMKWFMQYVNFNKVMRDDKIYAQYSLMIKNIPLFYHIDDVRKEILEMVPNAEICELFFVHQSARLEVLYRELLDLHFQIQFTQDNIREGREGTQVELQVLRVKYVALYEEVQGLKRGLILNNGRAIIVFNKISDRNEVKKRLEIGECDKISYHTRKLLKMNTRKLHFYADKIAEPQEILWNFIGESSSAKTKVRIETTVIGFGFMLVCFMVLYFPYEEANEKKILDRTGIGAYLSLIIALIIQILSVVYRLIILKLIPSRQPSSRQSESYFIVITTIVFHFFFYLVAPGTYFALFPHIPTQYKLQQLFVTIMLFLAFSLIIAFIDIRYQIFRSRRKSILSAWTNWGKYCQVRLHEMIRYPTFPIEFKLMVLLKIWAFNSFYIFQIPYVLLMFIVVMFIIFWNDKRNIYRHYKMQTYLSIDLELCVLRDFIFMFLVCVGGGYATTCVHTWQYIFMGVICLLAIILNIGLTFQDSFHQKYESQPDRTMTLGEKLKTQTNNPKQSMLQSLREADFKEHLFVLENNAETASLGSVAFQHGYREIYDTYLMQFKNKHVIGLLEETYLQYRSGGAYDPLNSSDKSTASKRKLSKESEMTEVRAEHNLRNNLSFGVPSVRLEQNNGQPVIEVQKVERKKSNHKDLVAEQRKSSLNAEEEQANQEKDGEEVKSQEGDDSEEKV